MQTLFVESWKTSRFKKMPTIPHSPSEVDAPRAIRASSTELRSSKYDTPNVQAALEGLHQDGLVVLKSVVDVAHVDKLNSYMTKEADDLVKNNTKAFNQGVNCRYCLPIFFSSKLKVW
jgi:hypothetical protein